MTPKRWAGTCAVTLIAAAVSYSAGKHSVGAPRLIDRLEQQRHRVTSATAQSTPIEQPFRFDASHILITNAASVPFSELYEILREASDEQILCWATQVEVMKENPRRTAALLAFYGALVQVNARLASRALLETKDLKVRDIALAAALNAAPEAEWPTLAEMTALLPFSARAVRSTPDFIAHWAQSDPAAATNFVLRHDPPRADDDQQFYIPIWTWASIDPRAAREWLEANPAAMNPHAIRGLLAGWEAKDRAGAIGFAIDKASDRKFHEAVEELANTLLREAPDECRDMVLRMPKEAAATTVEGIAITATAIILHAPPDYQRPAREVALWMSNLPIELWKDHIGALVVEWHRDDPLKHRRGCTHCRPQATTLSQSTFAEMRGSRGMPLLPRSPHS